MKKFYTFLVALCATFSLYASPVITASTLSGNWHTNSSWDLNRQPQNGDTVLIPAGKTILVTDIQNYSTSNLFIKVYGILSVQNGKLWLSNASTILVFAGGSILSSGSPSETLKIGSSTVYQGPEGTINGPIVANSSTGGGFSSFPQAPLPVKFIGFNLARQNNDVLVQWATSEEINSSYFDIQRSDDGANWTSITHVTAAGYSYDIKSYSYTDKNATSKILYYRIRQVDFDGKAILTTIRMIKNDTGVSDIKISSAGTNAVYVFFPAKVSGNLNIQMRNASGQLVAQQTLSNPVGQQLVTANNAVTGILFVTVTDGQGLMFTKQVML